MRWTVEELHKALSQYEQACIAAGMKDNAVHSYWDYARRFLDWRIGSYRPRRSTRPARLSPLTPGTTADLAREAKEYAADVETAGLAEATVDTYLRHAMFFVRWLDGDFEPGRRLRGRSRVR